MKIDAKVMDITPQQAAIWLQGNIGNRPVCKSQVDAMATDMINGEWALNGETIKIAFDAEYNPILLDGQHRLNAVVQSGVTIKSLVVFSVDDARFIDNGRARSFKDSIILGDNNLDEAWKRCNLIVAIARFAIKNKSSYKKVTNAQVAQYMKENADALMFVYEMQNKVNKVKGLLRATAWAAIKAAYDSGYDREKLSQFCSVYANGEGTSKYHTPIIRFRNWCIANSATGCAGATAQKIYYNRCQYALKAFEIQNVTAMTKEATKEYYKLK